MMAKKSFLYSVSSLRRSRAFFSSAFWRSSRSFKADSLSVWLCTSLSRSVHKRSSRRAILSKSWANSVISSG